MGKFRLIGEQRWFKRMESIAAVLLVVIILLCLFFLSHE